MEAVSKKIRWLDRVRASVHLFLVARLAGGPSPPLPLALFARKALPLWLR
jgi:hypothetical protein